MDTSIEPSRVTSETSEQSEDMEFLYIFYTEYKHLLGVFKRSLDEIIDGGRNKQNAHKDIFRVYHTLKGDSAYFPEFNEFTKFISEGCEGVRDWSEEKFSNQALFIKLNLDYSRLSSILSLEDQKNGKTIKRFRAFLKNF